MCLFANSVADVGDTLIFVGASGDRQLTVYQMEVTLEKTGTANAMILPVPGAAKHIELIDLRPYPGDFFVDLNALFPDESVPLGAVVIGFDDDDDDDDPLPVRPVGSFDVTVVPTVDDIRRVNRTAFTLSDQTEAVLRTHYPEGFAFVVARLRDSSRIHPLAYVSEATDALFVPTRHEHGHGHGHRARWDHAIYYQADQLPRLLPSGPGLRAHGVVPAGDRADDLVRIGRAMPAGSGRFVDPTRPLSRLTLAGELTNQDLRLPHHGPRGTAEDTWPPPTPRPRPEAPSESWFTRWFGGRRR